MDFEKSLLSLLIKLKSKIILFKWNNIQLNIIPEITSLILNLAFKYPIKIPKLPDAKK